MRFRIQGLLIVALLGPSGAYASHVPEVPNNVIMFRGDPYRAWWHYPSFPFVDTFRLLCGEPCPLGSDYMSAKYAGFKSAYEVLMPVTGIDILPRNWPFDLHLTGPHFCGPWDPGDGQAAFAASHSDGSLACFWTYEKAQTGRSPPLDHDTASTLGDQLVEIHEYAHVIFYRRHWWSYEDVVIPLSFYVALGEPYDDPCHRRFDRNGRGRLIYELCEQHGFEWPDLAPALVQLDSLYQSGAGYHQDFADVTAAFQFRRIFDGLFGASTQDAFRASFMHPATVGDESAISQDGGNFLMAGGAAMLQLPAWAVSFPMDLRFVTAPVSSVPDLPDAAASQTTVDLAPGSSPHWQNRYLDFFQPARLTFKYRDYDLPTGIQEPSMGLKGLDYAGNWSDAPASFVDLEDATVSGEIDGLGTYAMAGPRGATDKLPSRIVPLVLGGSDAGVDWSTTLRLHNPVKARSEGRLVFRAEGRTATAADPSVPFSLGREETLVLEDLAGQFGASGPGNVDLFMTDGHAPEMETRVFSEEDGYTYGGGVKTRKRGMALRAGETGVLLVPMNLDEDLLRVGIRTLSAQTTLGFTVYAQDGTRRWHVVKTFGPGVVERQTAQALVRGRVPSWARFAPLSLRPNRSLEGGESLHVEVLSGEALVSGDTVNLRGDIDMQYARPLGRTNLAVAPVTLVASTNAVERADFPIEVRSWETRLRLHNPTGSVITGKLVLHTVTDAETGETDAITAPYTIAPRASHLIADVPAHFALCAIGHPCPVMRRPGSLEIVPQDGPAPLALARVQRNLFGAAGAGYTQEAVSPFAPLQSGEFAILPVSNATLDRSLGMRTFGEGVTFTLYNEDDRFIFAPRVRIIVGPDTVRESPIADLMGDAFESGRSVRVRVEAGRALMWSLARDPASGDPTFHQLRRMLRPL